MFYCYIIVENFKNLFCFKFKKSWENDCLIYKWKLERIFVLFLFNEISEIFIFILFVFWKNIYMSKKKNFLKNNKKSYLKLFVFIKKISYISNSVNVCVYKNVIFNYKYMRCLLWKNVKVVCWCIFFFF